MPRDHNRQSGWRRWLNPSPLSREWWISWSISLLVFGALTLGLVIYCSLNPDWLEQFNNPP